MPTYDYQCKECGYEWEAEHKISAAPLTECPKCKKPKAKRMISKGTGFVLVDGPSGGWAKSGYK